MVCLADVYGSSGGPQEAEIIVDLGSGDVVVPWTAGAPASETLLQVAVFDSSAAQLYVDGGNQIQFLPFGLALPHNSTSFASHSGISWKLSVSPLRIRSPSSPLPSRRPERRRPRLSMLASRAR